MRIVRAQQVTGHIDNASPFALEFIEMAFIWLPQRWHSIIQHSVFFLDFWKITIVACISLNSIQIILYFI